jgi:hypothetical protein
MQFASDYYLYLWIANYTAQTAAIFAFAYLIYQAARAARAYTAILHKQWWRK